MVFAKEKSQIGRDRVGQLLQFGALARVGITQLFPSGGASWPWAVFAINIGGGYDTLQRPDTTAYQYYPINPTTQTFDAASYLAAQGAFGAGGSPVSFYPNYVNMPLSADLSLIGTYSQQHYAGEYGTTVSQNISENKYYWTGALQYNIPKTNSSLSVQDRQYRYTDAVLPTYNSTENRQDVFFTVRF